jgi:hypothetical protein
VTVTIEDPAGTDAALAWAQATHAKLLRADRPSDVPRDDSLEAPECAIHHVAMVRVQGKLEPFWSCHQKNSDGSGCNYRPNQQ